MDWSGFALLMIDVQQDFWTPARRQLHPQFPSNVEELLASARAQGVSVIHLRAAFDPSQSDWMPRHRLLGQAPCVRGTPGIEALDCAREQPGEKIIWKQTFNGFSHPELDRCLKQADVGFVLLAGLVTSVCVLATALGSAESGYLAAVIEDCCADNRTNEATLKEYPFALERVDHGQLAERQPLWQKQLAEIGR